MDDETEKLESDDYHDEPEPDEPVLDMPAIPTNFLPGSESKIDALRSRYERGEPLWHPDDMTFQQFAIEQSTIDSPTSN